MRTTRMLACLIAPVLLLPTTLQAQETANPRADAVADHPADDLQAARDRLHALLLRPDVRRVARDRGIDLRPMHDGIDRMPASALAQIAPHARAVENADARSAITLSTTAIIVILLIVLLILLVD